VGRDLSSEQSSDRARAAARLLELSPRSARPLVELALEDEDDAVRLAAARAAVAHGMPGLGDQVAGWLKDPAAPIRAAALRVLSLDLDTRHVAAVARMTLDADEQVRVAAVRCLGRARLALASEVTSALTAALDDASAIVRTDACVGLGRVADASSVPALVPRLLDAEESVRRAAAVALGAIGDTRATAALSFALDDRSVAVAALAALSLGDLGDPNAAAALEAALEEPGWGPLQVAAAEALAALDQRRSWDAIVTRLSEQDAAPSLRVLFDPLTPLAAESIAQCLEHSGGVGLLECARVAASAGLPLDVLLGRVRRGSLPTAKLFQVATRSSDVELLVLAIERLVRGSLVERHAALQLLDQSAPLPAQTSGLLGEALSVPGLAPSDVARLLLLLGPKDVDAETLGQLTRASDAAVAASARALRALGTADEKSVLAPFDASGLEADAYGHLLGRGMDRVLAERLIAALAKRSEPLPRPVLRALQGLPSDLSPRSVQELAGLLRAEGSEIRDELLPLLARQGAGGPELEAFLARGSVQDRRSLAALFVHTGGLGGLAGAALADTDPWVRALAAQGARSEDLERLLALTKDDEPAYVRTAALLGLARVAPKQAAQALRPCELLQVPELGIRVAALWLLDRSDTACSARPFQDLVLLEREPILRELAARALFRRAPEHRALRICASYDVEPSVALACTVPGKAAPALAPEAIAFTEIVPPWRGEPAPGFPYALLDGAGSLVVGVTDRRGQAPLSRVGPFRILDPRIAL